MSKIHWGVDLGGTKVEAVVLQELNGEISVIERHRVPTEAQFGYDHILHQIKSLIDELKLRTGLQPGTIGFGTPGALDPITNQLKNSNTVCLNGKPLRDDLKGLLGVGIKMANDANCFALAETKMGVVKKKMPDANVVFGVIMGTGVGGGIVINGQVINGRQGIGGEWGHNYLDSSGGECYCGKSGCVERVISGTALEKYYKEKSGLQKRLKNIVEAYRKNEDLIATQTMERLFTMFGKGISAVINILDPDVIVLGGGLGNIDELYSLGVKEVEKYIFNLRLETVFLKPELGDSAGVFGAALL